MCSHAFNAPGVATLRWPTMFLLPSVSKRYWSGRRSSTGVYMPSSAACGATA